jgi:hypothetical protein
MNPNCVDRPESTVAPQALHLMNNGTIQTLAAAMAERLQREAGSDTRRQIELAFLSTLGRRPSPDEQTKSHAQLSRLAAAWYSELTSDSENRTDEERLSEAHLRSLTNLCRALFNSAAFLYVD